MVRFDLGTLLQGQTRIAKLKSAYNSLIIGPRGLQCKQRNIIMDWESFDVDRFDLGPLLIHTSPLAFLIKLKTVGMLCFCVQKPFV